MYLYINMFIYEYIKIDECISMCVFLCLNILNIQ